MNQTGGVQVERLDAIRSHLYAQGFSSIQELADAVGASLATIRRDLRVLETEGAIDRVHGGARIAEGSSVEMAFQERAKRNLAAGEKLDGEGGYTVYGKLMPAAASRLLGGLPLGLAHGVVLKRAIAANEPVRWDDVAFDAADDAVRFRREMESLEG